MPTLAGKMSRYDARLRAERPDLFEQGTGGYCTHEACSPYAACQIGHASDEQSFLARSILSDDDLAWCRRELARRNEPRCDGVWHPCSACNGTGLASEQWCW